MLNCVLLIKFYDLVLPKVIFSPNFLFFSFFPPSFSFPFSKPFDYFPPPTGGGNTEQYTGLGINEEKTGKNESAINNDVDDSGGGKAEIMGFKKRKV